MGKARTCFLVAIFFSLTGCGDGFFESGVDTKLDEYGNIKLLDTPNNWETWVLVVDADVAAEAAGRNPPGGHRTWDERWLHSINELGSGQENYQRYINYVIETRKQAGLPPLKNQGGLHERLRDRH